MGELDALEIPDKTYFKIGEVARVLDLEPYVLRYWESEFDILDPGKTESGQRIYQRSDIELLVRIRHLLYNEMFTIAGARRQLERSRKGEPSYLDVVDEQSADAGRVDALEAELEALQDAQGALEQEKASLRAELGAARDEVLALEAQLGEAQARLRELEERPGQLELGSHHSAVHADVLRGLRRELESLSRLATA